MYMCIMWVFFLCQTYIFWFKFNIFAYKSTSCKLKCFNLTSDSFCSWHTGDNSPRLLIDTRLTKNKQIIVLQCLIRIISTCWYLLGIENKRYKTVNHKSLFANQRIMTINLRCNHLYQEPLPDVDRLTYSVRGRYVTCEDLL